MFEPGGGGEDQIFTRRTDPQHQTEIEFGTEKTKKKTKKNKKRFTDDQVRWLESLFENETKLEPKQKVEAARELGLHPRQVAIWFQNKRARWKSKLLQRDFDLLRSNYDSLSSRFDSLKKQNLSLTLQLQKLKESVGDTEVAAAKDEESETKNKNNKVFEDEKEKKPELGIGGGTGYEMGMMREENYFAMEQGTADLVAMVEPACSSLTSDEEWHGLHSDGLFDQSTSSCEWWDFWS